ncbi:hypothetical protein C0J52_13756 [Blattella germanica]|nr:hypothetical protein C0J52_13756 [Blattella germanica]
MGFWISKPKPPELKTATQKQPKSFDPEEILLSKIRKTLNQDLETFLLNNIMLSVQFFDCFEREIGMLRVSSARENYPGIAEYRRHCIAPHRLYDSVSRQVQFRPQHGELSHHNELLHTKRLLVVHDSAEVVETRDSEYSSPCYRFTMESVTKHRAGYSKLRAEESSIPSMRRPTYETMDDEDEGVYTRISTDFPDETDNKDDLEVQEMPEKDTETVANVEQNGFEPEASVNRRVSSMLELQQEKAESVGGFSRKMSTKRIFGPQKPESEILKSPSSELTKTERRLSGIIKAYKFSNMNSIARAQKLQALKSAQSLPDLTNLPFTGSTRTDKTSSSPKNSGDSSGYKSEGGSPNHNNLSPPRSHSSDSDYGYATILELSKPKPLHQHRIGHIPKDISQIPKECFNTRVVPLYDDGDNNSYKVRRSLFENRCYLNSITFMRSFADIFVEKLALPLGFSSSMDSAMLQGSKIFCDVVQSGQDTKPVKVRNEITPTIFSSIWPKEALKWKTRTRNRMPDSRPGAMAWPTQAMIEHVQRLGCHFLPQGYMPTRGQNNEQYLEWQVAFPEAEQFLETCLTHSQIRCLLFSMALYKTFLESVNSPLGLHPMHFRTLLFWQCERNFIWPEDRPGVTLMKFLDKMYEALMQTNLSDYFIPRRNLFESTPRSHLLKVQEKLLRIRENPVMHLLIAVRNLRYVNTTFYPVLDCKKLYKIITSEKLPALLKLNSRLPPVPVSVPIAPKIAKQEESDESEESDGEEDDSNIDVWKPDLDKDAQHRWKKKVRSQIEIERAAMELSNPTPSKPRRPSIDSIDIRVQPRKGAEPLRKKALLEFFIPHFIEIARKSNSFRATRQAQFYLKHTEYLVKLLEELEDREPKNSWKYKSEIKEILGAIGRNPINSNATGTQIPSTSFVNTSANKIPSKPQSKNVPNLQKQNSKVQILDSHKVNPFREKSEIPNANPTSILKKTQKAENKTIQSVEVHKVDSGPPSPEILIDMSKSKPIDTSLTVTEVVTAESTDF